LNIDGYEITLHDIRYTSYGLRVDIEIRNVTADEPFDIDPRWLVFTNARGETIRGDSQYRFPRRTLMPGAVLRGIIVILASEPPDPGTLTVAYDVPGGTLTWLTGPVSAFDDEATPAIPGL
jgi:hypothetical protein